MTSKIDTSNEDRAWAEGYANAMQTVITGGVGGAEQIAPAADPDTFAGESGDTVKRTLRAAFYALLKALASPAAWRVPTLGSGWTAAGGVYEAPGYRLTLEGGVELRGHITGGSTGALFTLPVGFRPRADHLFFTATYSASGGASFAVSSAGVVTVLSFAGGASSIVGLNGIRFARN